MNQITEAFSQGNYTLGNFISKAFDTVNHNTLLEKLKAYGIKFGNLKWFRSYLSKKKQFISYDDSKREMKIVKCNVFQRFYSRAFSFSSLRKTSPTSLLKFLILRTEPN